MGEKVYGEFAVRIPLHVDCYVSSNLISPVPSKCD